MPGQTTQEAWCIRSLTVAALTAATLAAPSTAEAHHGNRCHDTRCVQRVAAHQCSQTRVVPCVRRAALHYRVSFPMLLRKARCESGLDPDARNAAHAGLFQFRVAPPSTWATTPYAHHDPFSAKWNSLAAAWAHSAGVNRGAEWACK